jgi:hypothetical protein
VQWSRSRRTLPKTDVPIWAKHLTTAARPFVVVIAVLVALGPAAPLFARLLGGPRAHVCHCEVTKSGHAHCECPLCFPELRDRHEPDGNIAIKGVCGDDDPVWRALTPPAIGASTEHVALRLPVRVLEPEPPIDLLPRSNDPPDPRPPRA